MADAALENAMRRHEEIASEIAGLRSRIDTLKAEQERIGKFIEEWHEFADLPVEPDLSSPQPRERAPPPASEEEYGVVRRRRAVGNPKKENVAEAARQIIAERGEPVSRTELFRALAERGVEIRSDADPEMVLSTMLWRMRHTVVRLKGGGYWLAERPLAPDHPQPDPSSAPDGDGMGKTDAELKAEFDAIVASVEAQKANQED